LPIIMKWGRFFKVSGLMDEATIAKVAEMETRRLYVKHLSTGRLARNFTFSLSNHNDDDFCKNLISGRILYDVVKIPRIIKRLKSTK
jgi:hypothetical protein